MQRGARGSVLLLVLVLAVAPAAGGAAAPSGGFTASGGAPQAHAKKKPVPCAKIKAKKKPARCRKKPKPKPKPKPRAAKPLTVTVQPDAAAAASAAVGPSGGAVAATGADGARFTLAVPPGAVLGGVTVTATPVRAVDGLPFSGGLVAAVHLEPEGLRLARPATLTVELPRAVDAARLTGFAYRGAGAELHLVPVKLEGTTATFTVTHFSGYGAAEGSRAERAAQNAAHPPTDPVDQAEQQTAAGAIPSAAHELSLLAPYYVLQGQLANPDAFGAAVMTYVSWRALAEGFAGLYPRLRALLTAMRQVDLPAAARRAIRVHRARCAANRDLAEAREITRTAGYATNVPELAAVRPDADAALDACVRFELDFRLALDERARIEPAHASVETLGVPLRTQSGGFPFDPRITGTKALTVLAYAVDPYDCWSHTWTATPAAPLSVRLQVDPNLYGSSAAAALVEVVVDPGDVDEKVTHTCGGDPDTTYTDTRQTYSLCFGLVHPDGRVGPWSYVGSATWARGQSTASDGDCSVTTTYELRHTPAP